MTANTILVFNDGSSCEVTRARPQDDWIGDAECPICSARPIKVLSYSDDPPAPSIPGYTTALAWCSGRHESVGYLKTKADQGRLVPMGEGPAETFRCRIYG